MLLNLLRGLAALGMVLLNILLMVLGLFVIPVAILFKAYGREWSTEYLGWSVMVWNWSWLQSLWGNEEDGIDGDPIPVSGPVGIKNPNWFNDTKDWSQFRTIFVWSAWRNSVNNLRFTAIGRSPVYAESLADNFNKAFLTKGFKFWAQYPLSKGAPYRVLWLGWKPGVGAGFKSTITTLDKVGA